MRRRGLDSWSSWVVAVSSSIIFLLISWPMRLGAQLFVSMLDRYDTNRKDASFPFALASLMRSLSGPFAGFLGGIIGLEAVTVVGCVFCIVGVGGCFFAERMLDIDISLGLIYGIGFGWSTCLVPEIINRNFRKHRNKAYGIYFGGGGLGAFVSPPILEVILHNFGVSGTFLIMCGIILHSVPAAMLLNAPKTVQRRKLRIDESSNKNDKNTLETDSRVTLNAENERAKESTANRESIAIEGPFQTAQNPPKIIFPVAINTESDCDSLIARVSTVRKQSLDQEVNIKTSKNAKLSSKMNLNAKRISLLANESTVKKELLHEVPLRSAKNSTKNNSQETMSVESHNLLTKEPTASRQPSSEVQHSSNEINIEMNNFISDTRRVKLKGSDEGLDGFLDSQEVVQSVGDFEGAKCNSYTNKNVLDSSIESSLRAIDILWHPLFVLISSLLSVCLYLNYLFWTITVDMMRDKGIEQHLEVYFVMFLSLFDTAGRFFLGALIDGRLLTVSGFCATCFAVTGLSCFLFTWFTDFYSNIAAICLLGLVFGGNTACFTGIVTEFIHEQKRAIAISSRMIMYVPMSFTMPPLIGYFRGQLGSYDGLLYVMTVTSIICAILTALLPQISKMKFFRQAESDDKDCQSNSPSSK